MSNMRVVTALIPWNIAQKLDQLSEREGRSKAWFIRLALTDYLAKVDELDKFIQQGMDAHEGGNLVGHEQMEREVEQWQQE
ncbi:MAG: ribbon-helix-helix protein, CopG family [Halieaceae bacterium]|nr:ribbon-helix-helix protein, CopG family [Halieaceae bacterium]